MRHLFDRHVLSFLIVVFGFSVIPLQAEEIRLSALDLSKMTQGYGKPGQDKSAAGLPLKIAGREFKHGVGTHAPSLFYVNLGGAAQRFHAFVGINDGGRNEAGSVEFLVRGDGKELFRSPVMKGGDAAREVSLDLTGVNLLTLEATDGGDNFNSDHADWAEATLTYEKRVPSTADIVSVTEFGARPNSRENAVPAVQKALEACRGRKNALLVFPAGRYDFWPQHCVEREYHMSNTTDLNPKRCAILIDKQEDLTIEGQGSSFIFHDRMSPVVVDNSARIALQNFSIDWDRPLSSQGEVKAVTDTYLDLSIDPVAYPYVIENGKIVFVGEGWKSAWWGSMEFDAKTRRIPPHTGDGTLGDWGGYTAVELERGLVRLNHAFTNKPAVGNFIVMRHSERDHAGIFLTESKDLELRNIEMYANTGLGVLAQFTENLSMNAVNVRPNIKNGRYLSGHDDGAQISNCRGLVKIENCVYQGLMDDPINVHGTSVRIIEKKSGDTLLARFIHPQSVGMPFGHPGDKVSYLDNTSMLPIEEGTVKSFKPLSVTDFEITFEAPVPDGVKAGHALENLTWAPEVEIRGCTFASCRARGLLLSTPGRTVIEKNRFESSGSAILIAGDANQWYESGAVRDVLIRDNVFDNCLTNLYQFCDGVISVYPEIPAFEKAPEPFHHNIRIENNTFLTFDFPVLYACSVDGLKFSGNKIVRTDFAKPFHNRKFTLNFAFCRNVEVSGTEFEGDVLGKNIKTEFMKENDLQVKSGQGFLKP